jgi:Zn-dependent protease
MNLMLAFFNLIPIPPLDGSGVLEGLLPEPLARGYRKIGRYGFLILIVIFYLAGLSAWIWILNQFVASRLGIVFIPLTALW